MADKKKRSVCLPEYKQDLSKLFDFEHPINIKEAFVMQEMVDAVIDKLTTRIWVCMTA